jgi:hypothetical protein
MLVKTAELGLVKLNENYRKMINSQILYLLFRIRASWTDGLHGVLLLQSLSHVGLPNHGENVVGRNSSNKCPVGRIGFGHAEDQLRLWGDYTFKIKKEKQMN